MRQTTRARKCSRHLMKSTYGIRRLLISWKAECGPERYTSSRRGAVVAREPHVLSWKHRASLRNWHVRDTQVRRSTMECTWPEASAHQGPILGCPAGEARVTGIPRMGRAVYFLKVLLSPQVAWLPQYRVPRVHNLAASCVVMNRQGLSQGS